MDFAKKQLEKYGWIEGKGLGKNENGISEALKPKQKVNNAGIGCKPGDEHSFHWWENVYDRAADNIAVKSKKNKVKLKTVSSPINITSSKYLVKKKNGVNMEYGTFIKTSKMSQDGSVDFKTGVVVEELNATHVSLTDEQLFAACGGRTAHKGARHGLSLKGKLDRVAKHDRDFMDKLNKPEKETTATEKFLQQVDPSIEYVRKKKSKRKRNKEEVGGDPSDHDSDFDGLPVKKSKPNPADDAGLSEKKLKKRRKKEKKAKRKQEKSICNLSHDLGSL